MFAQLKVARIVLDLSNKPEKKFVFPEFQTFSDPATEPPEEEKEREICEFKWQLNDKAGSFSEYAMNTYLDNIKCVSVCL